MTNKLISLVIIILYLLSGHSYSEEQFIFPKKKPSIFKQIEKTNKITYSNNLPQKKPLIPEKYEVLKNPPSRSAKLRYAIKINENQDFSDFKKKFKYLLDIEKIC